MTRVHASPAADFKNCCMRLGFMDGVDRDYFFQGLRVPATHVGRGAGSLLHHCVASAPACRSRRSFQVVLNLLPL
jgi:hypothetical protein